MGLQVNTDGLTRRYFGYQWSLSSMTSHLAQVTRPHAIESNLLRVDNIPHILLEEEMSDGCREFLFRWRTPRFSSSLEIPHIFGHLSRAHPVHMPIEIETV